MFSFDVTMVSIELFDGVVYFSLNVQRKIHQSKIHQTSLLFDKHHHSRLVFPLQLVHHILMYITCLLYCYYSKANIQVGRDKPEHTTNCVDSMDTVECVCVCGESVRCVSVSISI